MSFIIFVLITSGLVKIQALDKIIGPGTYSVTDIVKCSDTEDHIFEFEVHRRKVNRTHDGFNCLFTFKEALNDTYAVRLELCKFVDGGCKLYIVLNEDSFTKFLTRYIGKNIENILAAAGVNPPDFPIQPGKVVVQNYMFNYEELPKTALYGVFRSHTTVLKRDGESERVVGCFDITFEFESFNDNINIL